MASTYTQNAGIEKPGTGDQSGTWGVTTNTNFDIIDRAVHGQVTISSIAGNTVLTTSDGALSNGIAPVIILTGSPGATFELRVCLLYTSPSPRDRTRSRMPSSA